MSASKAVRSCSQASSTRRSSVRSLRLRQAPGRRGVDVRICVSMTQQCTQRPQCFHAFPTRPGISPGKNSLRAFLDWIKFSIARSPRGRPRPREAPMKFSLQSTVPLLSSAILFASAPSPVFAQSADASVLDEVIVTARRVEENLQDTPIAITALSAESLEERQIFRTDALDQVVPNLQFSNNAPLAGNNASSAIFIRGIGQTDPTSTVDPGVGLYIDEVYMGTAVGGTMEFRDIANVQVLRGPQGTLFGRNTIGGAILLTTTEPGDEFGGTVRVGAGSDSLGEFFGALDVPFSETLKSRVSFGLRKQDGYVERNFDGKDLGDTNTWTTT